MTSQKIKIFIWNSLHGALPVGEQFAIRQIPLPNQCPRCRAEESITHALFTCPFATKVWDLAPFSLTFHANLVENTLSGLEASRKIPSLPPVGLAAGSLSSWIVWSIWLSRNQLLFQRRDFTPEETVTKAITDAREWTLAQNHPTNVSPGQRMINLEPNPNRQAHSSIFIDAAWNPSTGCAGFGWIIDDPVTPSQHAATETFVSSPLMAEALALRQAIIFALNTGIRSAVLHSNSLSLIKMIRSKTFVLEVYGVLHDIFSLSNVFSFIKFVFVPRAANDKTDSVAKQALYALNHF
ncbi:hypothetical protein Bca52824_039504 [Brassica carinata]|uniref:RNase H type-1 domain-containing protein n=1 Tax=Brassica carinata TaxID=52824 RepID=A0A8X7RR96_BRACI|nr:hypothetical protein Bca52824_039504 [Brassica carinata]